MSTSTASRFADRLLRLSEIIESVPAAPAAGALVVVAAAAHAATGSPDLVWLTAVAVAVASLADARWGLWLAAGAGALHGAVDLSLGDFWFLGPFIRLGGLLLAAAAGAGTKGLIDRYRESHHRSLNEDSVTGLLNVRAFYDGLAQLHQEGRNYSILLADIAGMRNLNQRYGHPTGTEAMRALGHVLRRSTKESDLVARLGSDEVAIALVGANREGALAAARRLSRLLADAPLTLPDGRRFYVHAHYGIATSETITDETNLLRAADRAKHAAKEHGSDEIGVIAGGMEGPPSFIPAAEPKPNKIPKKSDKGVWSD